MTKIPGSGAGHQVRRPSSSGLAPFDRIPRDSNGRHPVDLDVENRLDDRVRQKWIIKLQDRIIQLTGPHSRLLLKLETMLDERSRDRERCYFNAGYELGCKEARSNGDRRDNPHQEQAKALVSSLQTQALKEGIPHKELMLALLRGALAIAEAICREIAVRTEAQPRRADHSIHTTSLRIGCDRAQMR